MWYHGNYVLADPDLDPADLYLLTTTIGHPLMAVMDYTDLALGLTAQPTTRQARLVEWFCALIACRIADIVDFEAYEADFSFEQLADYQIEWPDSSEATQGTEPRRFYDKLCLLQEQGVALNFIDLMIGQFSKECCWIAEAEAGGAVPDLAVAPLLAALAIGDEPRPAELVPIIDNLLYAAGVPLRTERYVMTEEGVGTETWKALEEGAMSDGWMAMTKEHLDEFMDIRTQPFDMPPNVSHVCSPPFTYSIHLRSNPEDE